MTRELNAHRILLATIRQNFLAFIQKSFQTLNPGSTYLYNWHIDAIANTLLKCMKGDIKRLIINLPPRHLKSHCVSIAFPAFVLGHDPTRRFICASYSNVLSANLSNAFRAVVETDWYREAFPKMSVVTNTELEVTTTARGLRFATSVHGSLTGLGGHFIILDDPLDPLQARSDAHRERANEWVKNTVYSRLDGSDGVIIVVMQRLHPDDLVGHLRELDDWTVLNIPAVAPEDTEYELTNGEIYMRRAGEVIDPSRFTVEDLERTRNLIGLLPFQAQYQQDPQPIEGNLIRRQWLREYDPEEFQDRRLFEHIVHSWDPAVRNGETNDYSVGLTFGVIDRDYYLLDVFRRRVLFPELLRQARQMIERDAPSVVLIERAGSGDPLAQYLREEGYDRVRAIDPSGSKVARMSMHSAVIEQRRLWLPSQAPWLDEFLREILNFPNVAHDDQVDALSQFLHGMLRQQRVLGGNGRRDLVRRDPIRRDPVRRDTLRRRGDDGSEGSSGRIIYPGMNALWV